MLKTNLRLEYKNRRKQLTNLQIDNFSIAIANRLLNLPIWDFSYYHIFLSIQQQKEVNTNPVISILQGRDKNVIVPKITGEDQLTNYLLTDSTLLKTNALGIPEPYEGIIINDSQIEVIFIPLMVFDIAGNRIGYGKGFYDTLLTKCNSNVIKIGLSFFEAEDKSWNTREGDIPLDYCVTPEKTYTF